MKKIILLGLTVFLVMVMTTSVLAVTEITVWYHSGRGGEREITQDQVKRFNLMQDEVKVNLVQLPEGSYNEQVQAAAVAGDLPDVLDLDGPFIANYAWAGYLYPLDSFITSEMKKDFLPSILAQGYYQGKLYALGAFDSGLGIWGNKKYLADVEARIPESVDDAWTLNEFMEILKKLKDHPDVKYPIDFKMNYGKGEWFTYGFSPIFQAFGADLINRKELTAEGTVNGPAAMAAGAWFQALFEQGYANPNPPGDAEFINGEAALSWVGHWVYNQYTEALGNDLILIPMPKIVSQATGMGSWAWGITSNSKHPEAAWKFLEFILQPEEIVMMSNANGAVPSRLSATRLSKIYKSGGKLDIFVEQLQKIAVERPVTPAYPVITDSFATAIDNIINGSDVRTELNQVAANIEEEIDYLGLK